MHVQIIHNEPGYLICIKPAGIVSESPGLPDLLCQQEGIRKLYPVHRLDQGTGGLILLAKDPSVCSVFSDMFAEKRIKKEYLAVVQAQSAPPDGLYHDYLYHDKTRNKTFVVKNLRKGVREAVCTCETLRSVASGQSSFHLLRIIIETGRTHQIRVQLASRGYPLAGDSRYGSKVKMSNPALWAYGLSFPDPYCPESILSFHADPPATEIWNLFIPFEPIHEEGSDGLYLQQR